MTRIIFLLSLVLLTCRTKAQDAPRPTTSTIDFMLGVGSGQTNVSGSYQYVWKFGTDKRLTMGVGMRLNGLFATNKYFVTAPAKIAKGESGPAAFFKKEIPQYMDSVQFPSTGVYALNFLVSVGYSFSDRISAGFNIDVIGVSFGGVKTGNYINGNAPDGVTTKPVTGAPTGFNLLLIGENDLGSLNSEFFLAYELDDRWSVKLGVQHTFMEYTTEYKVQQLPEPNDRFRNVATVLCFGVVYRLHDLPIRE